MKILKIIILASVLLIVFIGSAAANIENSWVELQFSNLNNELRFTGEYGYDFWDNFRLYFSPDFSYGTEDYYTLDPDNWKNTNLTERSIFTADKAYLEFASEFFLAGFGIYWFDLGIVPEPTAFDINSPIDALELYRPLRTGQPTVWMGFRFSWFEIMTSAHIQGAGKVPWEKGNPWRPRCLGDYDLMKPHGGNEVMNFTVWTTFKSGRDWLRLHYYRGQSTTNIQLGKVVNGETPVEPDWQPVNQVGLAFHKVLEAFSFGLGTVYTQVDEWKDNTLNFEMLAMWKPKPNLELSVQTIREYVVEKGYNNGFNNNNLSCNLNVNRQYADSYKLEGKYSLGEGKYDLGASIYMKTLNKWQLMPGAYRHFGNITVGLEVVLLDNFFDEYPNRNLIIGKFYAYF